MSFDALASGWAKGLGVDRKQFDMFFDKMLDGFAYHKIVVDKAGKPVDYVFLEVNHAFEKMTGLKRERIIGKKVTEVLLGIEKDPANWIGVYGKVALTGEPAQFENHTEALSKWFKVVAYSPEKYYFVALFEDITERKKTEDSLRLSEENYRHLLQSAPTAIYEIDYKTPRFKSVNDAMTVLTGYSREELLALNPADLLDHESQVRFQNRIRRGLAGEKIGDNVEYRVIVKDGRKLWVVLNIKLTSTDGKYDGALVVGHDVTERKNAEEALKTTLDRFYTSLSNMHGAILLVSPEGNVEFANQSFCDYFSLNESPSELKGLSSEEIIGKIKNSYLYPDQEVIRIEKIVAAGKPVIGEEVAMNCNRTCLRDFIPLSNVGESFSRLWYHMDITERKKAEEALSRINEELEERVQKRTQEVSSERQRLYNVLETLPAYVVLLDKDYRMPFANKVFRELFGESHGRRCHEFLFGRGSECENCETYKVLKTDKPQHWEWTGPNKHDYEIYDYPFVEADGSTRILEMGIDVTERKKAERDAQEAAKKLKNAERLAAIGATAGMVGHDIRNPLQAITGDVYLAKMELSSIPDGNEKKNALESLAEIEKNVDYINKIVADLQDFARPLRPNFEETNLKPIIDDLLKKNGVPENVKVIVKVEPEAGKFVADSSYINRIMYNLVNNAVQAMPKGGRLIIHAYREENDILMSVKDTGAGIPDAVKGKLFTPMFTTKSKGQGFGLAVIKRMTEALGGTVAFESREGKGTKFTIRLPISKETKSNRK